MSIVLYLKVPISHWSQLVLGVQYDWDDVSIWVIQHRTPQINGLIGILF